MFAFLVSRAAGLLGRIPLAAWALAALAGWGLYNAHELRQTRANAAISAINASNLARSIERTLSTKTLQISDELQTAQTNRQRDAGAVNQRLRNIATNYRSGAAPAAACRNDAAPAAVIPDAARANLVELAADADAVADQLRACQAYVSAVTDSTK